MKLAIVPQNNKTTNEWQWRKWLDAKVKLLQVGWHNGVAVKEQLLLDKSPMSNSYIATTYGLEAQPFPNKLLGESPR